jgi:cytochrome c553
MKYNLKTASIFMPIILLCLLGFSGLAHAVQVSGSCPGGHTMDMGGMHMSANKSVAKRAEAECSNCHGTDGNGVNPTDDVPNLAGQDFMYLCAWLSECRKKGKQCESHEDIAAKLSDHDIVGLAMFYTHLPSNKW